MNSAKKSRRTRMNLNSFWDSKGQKFQRVEASFTLIELLVVISIIATLASTVLVSLTGTRAKARDARRLQDIDQLVKAIELYYFENETYPGDADNGGIQISPKCASDLKNDLLNAEFSISVPGDPIDDANCNDITSANNDELFFYGWDSAHCCEGSECISINRLETQWAADLLTQKFGQLHYVTGGGDANIGTGDDFNYCFVPN